jgi:hypothetical protein
MTKFISILVASIAIAGLTYTIRTFNESRRDRTTLLRNGQNGAMVELAYQSMIREFIRLVKHCLIVIAACLCFIPNVREPQMQTELITIRSALILIVAMLLALNSKLDLDGRRRVMQKQQEEINRSIEAAERAEREQEALRLQLKDKT